MTATDLSSTAKLHAAGATEPGWQVRLRGGEPPALDIVTDHRGRCEQARLFAAWREPVTGGVLDPAAYSIPPAFRPTADGAVEIEAYPLPHLRATWRIMAAREDAVVARIIVVNGRPEPLVIEVFVVSALRLNAENIFTPPSHAPLRIVRDVLAFYAAPDFSVALGLSDADGFGLRASWLPLWTAMVSGQGLGNVITQRPARERYAALAGSPLLKPGESREIRMVQAAAPTVDAAQEIARDLLAAR